MQSFVSKYIGTYGEQALAPSEGAGVHIILICIPVHPAQELGFPQGQDLHEPQCWQLQKDKSLGMKNPNLVLSHFEPCPNIVRNISPQLLSSYAPERLEI